MHPDYKKFLITVDPAIKELIRMLEKKYPGIGKAKYGEYSTEWTFKKRMRMGLYIELMKAGFIK